MSGIGAIGASGGNYYFAMQNAAGTYGGNPSTNVAGDAQGNAVNGAAGSEGVQNGECRTCAERQYVDGSNDPGVSFKTPTNIRPEASASLVRAHEQEHVSREQSKADAEGREIISQNVKLNGAVCSECGKSYISGGTTTTTTAQRNESKVTVPGIGENFDETA